MLSETKKRLPPIVEMLSEVEETASPFDMSVFNKFFSFFNFTNYGNFTQ